jgi:transposase
MAHSARLQADNDRLRKLNVVDTQAKLDLGAQLTVLKKIIFGKRSEKRAGKRVRWQDESETLLHSQMILPSIKDNQIKKLDEEIIYHEMTSLELKAESELRGLSQPSSDQWVEVKNFYDESVEITVIERQYKKLLHRRKKYKLKAELSESSDKQVIVTADGANKLLPGATYSIDFASSVVSDKYVSHMPLERQTRQMESLGLKKLSTKVLYTLCMTASVHLEELAERIKNEILTSKLCVHADETPWPIQIKEQDSGYMWVISNQAGTYYFFEPTRSGLATKTVMKTYEGPVLVDGYTGYNSIGKMENIFLAYCWAHARRKFADIEKNFPTEAKEILDLIDDLFAVERKAKTYGELKTLREAESKPLIEKIKLWLDENLEKFRAEDGLTVAINYSLKYWSGLIEFLEDTRIPLSNNEAERSIRHAVMGRKNFYGSRTHNGADIAAIFYTIIESCKKVEVDPRSFINTTLKLAAKGDVVQTPLEYANALRQDLVNHRS